MLFSDSGLCLIRIVTHKQWQVGGGGRFPRFSAGDLLPGLSALPADFRRQAEPRFGLNLICFVFLHLLCFVPLVKR